MGTGQHRKRVGPFLGERTALQRPAFIAVSHRWQPRTQRPDQTLVISISRAPSSSDQVVPTEANGDGLRPRTRIQATAKAEEMIVDRAPVDLELTSYFPARETVCDQLQNL
jgi:hypothetical protein